MIGLAEAFMGARRQRIAEEKAAADMAQRQAEFALRQQAAGRDQQLHDLQMEQAGRLRSASRRVVDTLNAPAAPDRQVIAAQDADFDAANAIALSGGTMPKADPALWSQPAARTNDAALTMALQGLAAERGDTQTLLALQEKESQSKLKVARKDAFKRYMGMSEPDLVKLFSGATSNPNIPGEMSWNDKTRKIGLKLPGQSAQYFDKGDVVETLMSLWEAENGDFAAGMKGLHEGRKARQVTADKGYSRSVELAKANEDAYFKGLTADNQSAAQRIAAGHLGVAQAASRRAAEDHAAMAPERQARGEVGKLRIELAKATDPAEVQRLTERIQALSTGTKGGGTGHDPADVAKARRLVATGIAPDEGTALDLVINKPDKLHASFVEMGLKEMLMPEDAVARADTVMKQMGWDRRGRLWSRAGGDAAAAGAIPAAADRKVGQTYQTPSGPMVWRGTGWEPVKQ